MNATDKVLANVERIPESGCWVWMGSLSEKGYAIGKPEEKHARIHRWLYKKIHGDIGDLTLDHVCKVRCCINPAHLEPVTAGENTLRGDGPTAENKRRNQCVRGHEFDRVVVRNDGSVVRRCLQCERIRDKKYRDTRRASKQAGVNL